MKTKLITLVGLFAVGLIMMAMRNNDSKASIKSADEEAVRQVVMNYGKTVSANDLKNYMSMYHNAVYRAAPDTVCTSVECVSWWVNGAFSMADFTYDAKIKHLEVGSELAYAVIGGAMDVVMKDGDQPKPEQMHPEVLLVLTKKKGIWKISAEMFHDYK